jgi:hypothetical protein
VALDSGGEALQFGDVRRLAANQPGLQRAPPWRLVDDSR